MSFSDQVALELIKALLLIGVAVLSTLVWSGWQKRREYQLATAGDFYRCCGEFYAVWKLWNRTLSEATGDKQAVAEVRKGLLDRAYKSEGALESILLRLAAEQRLSGRDVEY